MFHWTNRLAETGSWAGAFGVASLYRDGMGTASDMVAADTWFIIASARADLTQDAMAQKDIALAKAEFAGTSKLGPIEELDAEQDARQMEAVAKAGAAQARAETTKLEAKLAASQIADAHSRAESWLAGHANIPAVD